MKIFDSNKLKNEIIKNIQLNANKIERPGLNKKTGKYNDKYIQNKISKLNFKIEMTILLSIIVYLGLTFLTIPLTKLIGIELIKTFISPFNIPALLGITSLSIGTITRKLLNIKYMYKHKKIKAPKTEKEKLEQETLAEINLRMADYESLITDRKMSQEIKPEIPLSNTQNIFKKIETQKQKLKELTAKQVLLENFSQTKSPLKSILNSLLTAIVATVCTIALTILPLIVVNYTPIYLTAIPTLAQLLSPFAIIGISTLTYSLIKNNTQRKVFNKINKEFGNVLTAKNTYKELNSIEKEIEDIIVKIAELEIDNITRHYINAALNAPSQATRKYYLEEELGIQVKPQTIKPLQRPQVSSKPKKYQLKKENNL